ncbi:MAG: peptidylprolyl isomerase [Pseudomonadota bacterium]
MTNATVTARRAFTALAISACALTATAFAQTETQPPPAPPAEALGPSDMVNAAPQSDWVVIAPEEMLVMTLAPDAEGKERKVILQLMPPPFSQGWVANIKTLARAEWYDGTSVNRVQDNYVVQWGDPGHDNPQGAGIAKKPLPEGLKVMGEDDYIVAPGTSSYDRLRNDMLADFIRLFPRDHADALIGPDGMVAPSQLDQFAGLFRVPDPYSKGGSWHSGWPVTNALTGVATVHCYGVVGVGRSYSPDTGTGAELYTVIGHAPRHLDRNIALVGRIIGGMEHLSSLPRGSGALGFYTAEEADKRTPILSIRVASDLPEDERPQYEYLSTETETFARYAEARANRRDPFFITPAGGADICNIPVPVRPFEYNDEGAE